MNAICNLLLNIDQNVEQWELNSHALGAAQLSRWKSGYERYVHSRRKLEFVLDSLTVTPPWNPLLIGAAAVCQELLEAFRSLKLEFSNLLGIAERRITSRRDGAVPRDTRRPRLMTAPVSAAASVSVREGWAENPLFPVGGRFQTAGQAFPDLVVLQGSDNESFSPC